MLKVILSLFVLLSVLISVGQNVGLGTINPHHSAAFEIVDTSKGVLIPRMSFVQRDNIQNPAEGLEIYQTDGTKGFWYFDGQKWNRKVEMNASEKGDMLYWDGSNWVTVPAGQHGQGLFFCNGVPSWGGCTPLLTTTPISDITTSSAVSGGNITNDGGSTIISRGIVWDTLPNPTIMLSTKTNEGTGTGVFISTMNNLNFNTTYYVRSFGTNSNGTSYGNQLTFNTKPVVPPTITTNPIFDTASTSAKSGGNITDDGGSSITSRGIVWDTLPNPTINLSTKTNDGSGVGNFISNITNLSPNKTYYVRAYGTNIAGTSYGEELMFTTPNIDINTGLVAYYPFNGNANDESGNGNHGIVNGATLTTDRFGNSNKSYYFSGAGCGTRIDATINTTSIQNGLTISIWVLRVGNGCIGPRLLEIYNTVDGPGSAQWGWDNSNSTWFGSQTSSGNSPYSTFGVRPNNQWTHLVYTNNGSIASFYQDGVLINTKTSIGNPILGQTAAFGRMNHPAFDAFNGKLDDIRIYNRALSPAEVQYLYTH